MKQNLEFFDFQLSEVDINAVTSLDEKNSSFFSHQDPAFVEWLVIIVEDKRKNHDHSKEKKA